MRPKPLFCLACAIALGAMMSATHAATPTSTDFSGAWRLDDRHSDAAEALTAALRSEARKEQQSSPFPAPAYSSASAPAASGRGNGGGRHAGGLGGGHGRHGGSDGNAGKAPGADKDPIAMATYPMPPLLKVDSVLLVQQDAKTVQVRLNDGSQLTGKLDGQPHQSLNGNAMVRAHWENDQLHLSVRYADGTQLDQTWTLSPDGQRMVVIGAWKVPTLEQSVTFRRTYVGLH